MDYDAIPHDTYGQQIDVGDEVSNYGGDDHGPVITAKKRDGVWWVEVAWVHGGTCRVPAHEVENA